MAVYPCADLHVAIRLGGLPTSVALLGGVTDWIHCSKPYKLSATAPAIRAVHLGLGEVNA